jgi:uncharacterized membrane protein YhaH (DUF805 family)
MSAMNPTASAAGQVRLFSTGGRIGRVRYIGWSVGLWILSFVLLFIIGAIAAGLGHRGGGGVSLLVLAAYVGVGVVSILFAIQRIHDFDISGWLAVLLIVPIVNLFFAIALMVIPGTDGSNRFGNKPPANSVGVIILAAIAPLLVVAYLGIIFSIAIPAYQAYVHKARMAQQQQYQTQPLPQAPTETP